MPPPFPSSPFVIPLQSLSHFSRSQRGDRVVLWHSIFISPRYHSSSLTCLPASPKSPMRLVNLSTPLLTFAFRASIARFFFGSHLGRTSKMSTTSSNLCWAIYLQSSPGPSPYPPPPLTPWRKSTPGMDNFSSRFVFLCSCRLIIAMTRDRLSAWSDRQLTRMVAIECR